MEYLKLRKNKLVILSLFEEASLRGVSGLETDNDRIIVIKENHLNEYPRVQSLIKGKIVRHILIRPEECFLLMYIHQDKETIVTLQPGYIFYSNCSVYLEDNWIEENCYWEDSIFSIFYNILQHRTIKFIDAMKYLD